MTVQERADRLRAFVRLRRIAGETCRMPSRGPDCGCPLCDLDAILLDAVGARALADSASRGVVALLNDEKLGDQYVHILTCNASRSEPVGNAMCSCQIGRRIKKLASDRLALSDRTRAYLDAESELEVAREELGHARSDAERRGRNPRVIDAANALNQARKSLRIEVGTTKEYLS